MNGDLEGSAATPRPRISLCCITGGPLSQVASILQLYRPVVDEIVVAVNGRFTAAELAPLEEVADRILPCEMRADFLQERYRAWLYAQCSGEFICTVDSDEVPSAALLAALPAMASAPDVVTYLTACRWCFPDVEHWLDEYPWEPSWKMILVRNDAATLHIKGGVHEGVMAVSPYKFIELPIYHLSDATMSREQREAKVAFYDTLDGNQLLEDGRPVSEVFYLPERFALYEPAAIPEEDVALINSVLAADTSNDRVLERESASDEPVELLPGTVSYETILDWWPERPLSTGAYNVEVELRRGRTPERGVESLQPGEVRQMMVLLRNRGDVTLLRESRNRVSLSTRFFACTPESQRGSLVKEGGRFAFPADLHPGQEMLLPFEVRAPELPGTYVLAIDLVEELVRWFESGRDITVRVGEETGNGAASRTDSSMSSAPSGSPTPSESPSRGATPTTSAANESSGSPLRVRIQSVLYSATPVRHERYFAALRQSVRTFSARHRDGVVDLALADNSATSLYGTEGIEDLRRSFEGTGLHDLTYRHFRENPGHGGAHNRLFASGGAVDHVLVINPDTSPSPNLLLELLTAMTDGVGIVEARQLPLEHQKSYDRATGDTSWASGACSLVRREVVEATGGYDDDSFFLYCDDVDFSWRARLAGYRVVYQPRATCFHDKRLSSAAREQPSDTEVFHSGLAGLLLAAKYSRPDLVDAQLQHFTHSPEPVCARIAAAFDERRREGRLVTGFDPDGRVADFSTYAYSPLRFDYER